MGPLTSRLQHASTDVRHKSNFTRPGPSQREILRRGVPIRNPVSLGIMRVYVT